MHIMFYQSVILGLGFYIYEIYPGSCLRFGEDRCSINDKMRDNCSEENFDSLKIFE